MRLTVMTYNLRAGQNSPGGLEAVARVIAARAPDLVGAQEVDRNWERTQRVDQPAWLAERLGMHVAYGPAFSPEPGAEYGVALLSRWPIVAHETHPLYCPQPYQYPDRDFEQRAVLLACVALGAGAPAAAVVVTHFELIPGVRREQAKQVVSWAELWAGHAPLIVMGDFNAELGSTEIDTLCAAFTHAWRARPGSDPYITFPSGPRGACTEDGWSGGIDHIFLGPGWRALSCEVVYDETRASDHQPVVAVVEPAG